MKVLNECGKLKSVWVPCDLVRIVEQRELYKERALLAVVQGCSIGLQIEKTLADYYQRKVDAAIKGATLVRQTTV